MTLASDLRKKYYTYILGIGPHNSLAPDHHNSRAGSGHFAL